MGTAELRNLITKSINSADIGLLQYIAVAIDNYEAKELFSSSILTEDQIKELDKRTLPFRRREIVFLGRGKTEPF